MRMHRAIAGKDLAFLQVQSEFLGLGFFGWLKPDIAHEEVCVKLKNAFSQRQRISFSRDYFIHTAEYKKKYIYM